MYHGLDNTVVVEEGAYCVCMNAVACVQLVNALLTEVAAMRHACPIMSYIFKICPIIFCVL